MPLLLAFLAIASPLVTLLGGGPSEQEPKPGPKPPEPKPGPKPPEPEPGPKPPPPKPPETVGAKLRRSLAQTWTAQYVWPRAQWLHAALLAVGVTPGGSGSKPADVAWAEQIASSMDPVTEWRSDLYDKALLQVPADIGSVMSRLGFRGPDDHGKTPNASWVPAIKQVQEASKAYIPGMVADGVLGPKTMAGLSALWHRSGGKGRA